MQVGQCQRELLLIAGHRALRPHRFDGSQSADFHLLLRVGKRLLREGQGLILHPHVFVREHQVPVDVFDLVHGGNNLQTKSHVGNLAVILRDADKARVGRKAKALQQVLGKLVPESWNPMSGSAWQMSIGGAAGVIESHLQVRAPLEALQVGKIRSGGVLHGVGLGKSTGGQDIVVIELQANR